MEFIADLSRRPVTPRLCPLTEQRWLLFLRSGDLEISIYLGPLVVKDLVARAGVFLPVVARIAAD